MNKFHPLFGIALLGALVLSLTWRPMSFEERVVHIRVAEASPALTASLADEPIEVKAIVLDYGDDPVLQLKAQAALLAYPQLARRILPLYGEEPEFRDILRTYGEAILPPIEYYLTHDLYTVRMLHYAGRIGSATRRTAARLLPDTSAEAAALESSPAGDEAPGAGLTPELRGWYAVNFIHQGGHDVLGQFVMTDQGVPKRLQTERVLEGTTGFFTSGVRRLETRYVTDQPIRAGDIGWAAVDGAVMFSAVKLLRVGRAAASSGKSMSLGARTAAFGSRMARVGRLGVNAAHYAKWPAIALTAYVAVKHPGLLNDTFAGIAKLVGLPAWLGQFTGWSLLLLPVLYLGMFLFRLVVRPAIVVLSGMLRLLAWIEARHGRRRATTSPQARPVQATGHESAPEPPSHGGLPAVASLPSSH